MDNIKNTLLPYILKLHRLWFNFKENFIYYYYWYLPHWLLYSNDYNFHICLVNDIFNLSINNKLIHYIKYHMLINGDENEINTEDLYKYVLENILNIDLELRSKYVQSTGSDDKCCLKLTIVYSKDINYHEANFKFLKIDFKNDKYHLSNFNLTELNNYKEIMFNSIDLNLEKEKEE